MIWSKTDAGRAEMQQRRTVSDRQQRMLLLLVDGAKSEDMVLAHVTGITREHFEALHRLGLIEPADEPVRPESRAASRSARIVMPAVAVAGPAAAVDPGSLDYGTFTARLTQTISRELGLRGFALTLSVEKAASIQELLDVGHRVVDQVRTRKGDDAAASVSRHLFN